MSFEFLTDSSDYADDFEDDSQSISEAYSEESVFPHLFSSLEHHLNSNNPINTTSSEIPIERAVGFFLSQLSSSSRDISQKIHWSYELKLEKIVKKPYNLPDKSELEKKFASLLKSFMMKGRLEAELMNKISKKILKTSLDEARKWILLSLDIIEKEKRQAYFMIDHAKSLNKTKSEDLQDEFLWKRFIYHLLSLCARKVTVTEPSWNVKDEIKGIIENSLKASIVVKNIVSIEDYGYSPALGYRRGFQASADRKVEISGNFQLSSQIEAIINQFLTLTETRKITSQHSIKDFEIKDGSFLSRVCLEMHREVTRTPLTLFIYYDPREEKSIGISSWFSAFEPLTYEEDVNTKVISIELSTFKFLGNNLLVEYNNQSSILEPASIKQLLQLPQASKFSQSAPSALKSFYVIEKENFYASCKKNLQAFLRPLSASEVSELIQVYIENNPQPQMQKESFPDSYKLSSKLKYGYIIVKDSIYLSSGTYSKNWLVQIKTSHNKPKWTNTSFNNVCKWEGCLSSLITERQLDSLKNINLNRTFSNLKTQRKSQSIEPKRKQLNPIKRSGTVSDSFIAADHCSFHNHYKNVLKNSLGPSLPDCTGELWKASQVGLNWQEELSSHNRISQICNETAKEMFQNFFQSICKKSSVANKASENSDIKDEESFKLKQYKLIEELKNTLDLEKQSTNELKMIACSEVQLNSIKHLVLPLKEAYLSTPAEKLVKLKGIRKQFELLSAFRSTSYATEANSTMPFKQVSRPPTVPANLSELAPTERFRKKELNKKMSTSPYFDAQLRVVKRFNKITKPPFTSGFKLRSAVSPNRTTTYEGQQFSQTPM
ncbi:unnamed protein product [Blepharisma stoltei]|uniref:Uncharacterized protein n=1 Tax=Blepharisma stoltei TaxID=1481888 RepID=A0AAU9IN28_9CILI|nr:unnamed protein product [Blepharisma stoltei]